MCSWPSLYLSPHIESLWRERGCCHHYSRPMALPRMSGLPTLPRPFVVAPDNPSNPTPHLYQSNSDSSLLVKLLPHVTGTYPLQVQPRHGAVCPSGRAWVISKGANKFRFGPILLGPNTRRYTRKYHGLGGSRLVSENLQHWSRGISIRGDGTRYKGSYWPNLCQVHVVLGSPVLVARSSY